MTIGTKNKARSILYIFIISGLLSSTALIIMLMWNNTFIGYFDAAPISFLESVGLVSFVYVIYYGIRFGHQSCHNDAISDNTADKMSDYDKLTDTGKNISSDILKKIPDKEKREFKEFVSRCCGMNQKDNLGHSSYGTKSPAEDI